MIRRIRPSLFCFILFVAASIPGLTQGSAQKPAPIKPPKTSKAAAAKGANVKMGEIGVLDTAADTVSLKATGTSAPTYALIPKTRYLKQKREAQVSDFKVGEAVVLHLRKSRSDGLLQVSEMMDKASWDWMTELRHNVTTVTIKTVGDDTLEVTEGKDNLPLTYTISEKTLWERNGKQVTAAEFKTGERVSIVPRSLPSGNIMASVVADTVQGAAQGKEHKSTSLHGVLSTLDPKNHSLQMKTEAGEARTLVYTEPVEVKQDSKTVTLSALKPGQHIATRVKHDDNDAEIVWRITIETGSRKKQRRRRPRPRRAK